MQIIQMNQFAYSFFLLSILRPLANTFITGSFLNIFMCLYNTCGYCAYCYDLLFDFIFYWYVTDFFFFIHDFCLTWNGSLLNTQGIIVIFIIACLLMKVLREMTVLVNTSVQLCGSKVSNKSQRTALDVCFITSLHDVCAFTRSCMWTQKSD